MASLDLDILRALYAGSGSPAWVTAVIVVSFFGSGWMLLALLPALVLGTRRGLAAAVLATLVLTSGAVTTLKLLTARARPCNALAWAHALPIDLPTDGSLPSGHAAGSFAFAVFAATLRPRTGWPLVAAACLVALSRVALGVHYPSDVAAGAMLGSLFGWLGARAYRSWPSSWLTGAAPERRRLSSRG